jgi:hypothetical protein
MQLQRHLRPFAMTTISVLALVHPQTAMGGTFFIYANSINCWCSAPTAPQWNVFNVAYMPATQDECTFARAAFRIAGVPNDPTMMRRFEPIFSSINVVGDPFGAGAVFDNFVPLPGNTDIGYIYLYNPGGLPLQAWSIEAHQGMTGVTTPVAQFEGAIGTWVPQSGRLIVVGDAAAPCSGCEPFGGAACPFAVEPGTWSLVKTLYR